MTDIAALGISVDTSDVSTAVKNLDQLSKMGPPVEKAAKDIGRGAEEAARGTKKAGDESARTSRNVGQMGESMRAATAMAKSFGAAIGSAFAFSKAVNTIKDFDESLLRLRATSGATGEAMAQMEKQARTLGATSQFSAQQAAEAQNFLAMAGLKTSEILQATGSVMKFAAAGALDLARSADIATNVLGGMQLPVDQLERVMDTMVNTAQSANTNIEMLGQTFAYAAPLAVTAAIGVEELAAAAGALGDAGIQGGKAGTGLVGVIRQLSAVTDKGETALKKYGISLADIDIKANGLTTVLKTLGDAQLDTADAIHIFGTESAAAGLVLASSAEKVEQLADANEKAKGKLKEVSDIMETSLKAAFAGVTSAIEEMMLQTGDRGLSGAMKGLAVTTAGVINNLNGMLPEFAEANNLSHDFTRNIELATNAIKALGGAIAIWGGLRVAIFGATQAQLAFNLAARANPYLLIAGSIAAATYALYEFIGAQDRAVESTQRMWERAASSTAAYQMAMGEVGRTQNTIHELHAQELELQEKMQAMRDKGFKQYGYHANKYAAMENELLELQEKRKSLMDARATAEQNEFKRQEQQQQKELEFARQKEALDKQQAEVAKELARQQKEALKIGRETLKLDKEKDRALEERQREQKRMEDITRRSVEAVKRSNDQLKEEIQSIGKTRRELVEMERQKLRNIIAEKEHALAIARTTDASDEYISNLKEEIALLEERGGLLSKKFATEEVYREQQDIADFWRNITDEMGRNFTDAIIQGGANTKEALKRMFQNMVLRPIIQPIMGALAGGITMLMSGGASAMGLDGLTGGGGGGGMGLMNMLSMGKTAYQAATGQGLMGSLLTGYQTGGLSGVMQAGGQWVSGAFAGVNQTLGQLYGTMAHGSGMTYAPLTYQMGGLSNTISALGPAVSGLTGAIMGYQKGGLKGAAAGGLGGWGGAKLGAMAGSFAGPVGAAIGAVIGGSLGAIGGSKIFGSSGEKYKRTVGSATGYYGGEGYVSTGPSATWHPGSRQFGAEHDAALDDLNSAFVTTIGSLFDAFDVDSTIAATTRTRLRRTSGRMVGDFITEIDGQITNHFRQYSKNAKIGEAMEQFSDDIMGEYLAKAIVGSSLPEYFRQQFEPLAADSKVTAEQVAETLTGIFARFEGVNAALELTGHALYELTNEGMKAGDALIEASGGLEAMQAGVQAYYENFVSAEQQRLDYAESIAAAITAAGHDIDATQLMNATRDQYRELVEAQDLATESGRELWAALMQLSGEFSQLAAVWDNLEADRWSAEIELLQAMGREEQALALIRKEAIKGLTEEQVAYWDRTQAIRQQIKSLEDQRRAHEQLIAKQQQLIAKQQQALRTQRSTAADVLREMDAVFKAVSSGAKSLFAEVDSVVRSDMLSSKAFISDALLTAQTTGYLPDAADISSAIKDVQAGFRSEVFASQADADFERLVVANELKKLEEITGAQISEQERQIAAIESQIEHLQAQRESLADLYDVSQIQLGKLEDIDDSVQLVESAMIGVTDSIVEAQVVASEAMLDSVVEAHKVLVVELEDIREKEAEHTTQLAQEYTEFRQQLATDSEERDENRDQLIVELTEQVIELRKQVDVLNRHAQRTATAVNGRPDQPILVEMVNPPVVVVGEQ